MGVLDISTIRLGKVIKLNGQPYLITYSLHFRTAQRRANLKTRLKNLIDGSVLEKTFNSGEKADEADLERSQGSYLYKDEQFANFMDNQTYEQFSIALDQIEEQLKFLKENSPVDIMYFEGKPVSVTPPIKVTLLVTEAPPGVKGATASNVSKKVTLETGVEIDAPIFVESGDKIVINTETGEYVSRATDEKF